MTYKIEATIAVGTRRETQTSYAYLGEAYEWSTDDRAEAENMREALEEVAPRIPDLDPSVIYEVIEL